MSDFLLSIVAGFTGFVGLAAAIWIGTVIERSRIDTHGQIPLLADGHTPFTMVDEFDDFDPSAGCTVYNYSAVYIDANVTPKEAATMIVATLGAPYADKLVDSLIETI